MRSDQEDFGTGLGTQSVTAEERKSAAGPQKEESAATAEVEATGMTGGVTDLLVEKRKSLEQIRQRRVPWTRMILAPPAVLFLTLLWLMLFSKVGRRVLLAFTDSTFLCILRLVPDDPRRPLPAPDTDAPKDRRQSRSTPGDPGVD